jgi:hypothetical protein
MRSALILGVVVFVILLVAAPLLPADQYGALASAIQALAVVPAITVGALYLRADSHDRRVDRVLEFHEQLTSGEVQAARTRLTRHLRKHGVDGRPRVTSREELRSDPTMSKYSDNDSEHSPHQDVNLVLRFFERVNAARIAGSVDYALLTQLVGRHAVWLDRAIADEAGRDPRESMSSLADWANHFAEVNKRRYPFLRNWGMNRSQDFPDAAP